MKVVTDTKSGRILGIHIVGPSASDLISEAALALEVVATAEDMALTIHPHPTLGEALMEAAAASLGHAIHIVNRWKFAVSAGSPARAIAGEPALCAGRPSRGMFSEWGFSPASPRRVRELQRPDRQGG